MAATKTAFVTGAASGIGRATAEAFLARGYQVALADRNEAQGAKVATELKAKGECVFIPCDVTDDSSVKRAVEAAVAKYGRLDAAFNGAGINGDAGLTADGTLENWNKVLAVDLTGVFSCMRYEIPQMLKQGGGAIVNCASIAGLVAAEYLSAYVAAKHGVVGLTKTAALEYIKQNIRVNAVCPGMIDTPMFDSIPPDDAKALVSGSPIGRFGKPSEIAAAVVWLCDDAASFVTGHTLVADGGFIAR